MHDASLLRADGSSRADDGGRRTGAVSETSLRENCAGSVCPRSARTHGATRRGTAPRGSTRDRDHNPGRSPPLPRSAGSCRSGTPRTSTLQVRAAPLFTAEPEHVMLSAFGRSSCSGHNTSGSEARGRFPGPSLLRRGSLFPYLASAGLATSDVAAIRWLRSPRLPTPPDRAFPLTRALGEAFWGCPRFSSLSRGFQPPFTPISPATSVTLRPTASRSIAVSCCGERDDCAVSGFVAFRRLGCFLFTLFICSLPHTHTLSTHRVHILQGSSAQGVRSTEIKRFSPPNRHAATLFRTKSTSFSQRWIWFQLGMVRDVEGHAPVTSGIGDGRVRSRGSG